MVERLKPLDPFRRPNFNSTRYLQRHLVRPSVNVSDLHPIMSLRLAALFIDMTNSGLASDTPGRGSVQILSGVRTRAHQEQLYADICLRQGRCSMVANPATVWGVDAEGVQRVGSNHQAQRQSDGWARATGAARPPEFGYAVDLTTAVGWGPVHGRLARYGLDWPLRGSPYEPWHLEWFPRSSGMVPGPWPQRPGIHRPLFRGCLGGDVEALQAQLGVTVDGVYGPGTAAAVRRAQRTLKIEPSGTWWRVEQRRWERRQQAKPTSKPGKRTPLQRAIAHAVVVQRRAGLLEAAGGLSDAQAKHVAVIERRAGRILALG